MNKVLRMRTSVNHNQGSPRVRVHGQGCGVTAAAASTPRSAPAPPRPRSRSQGPPTPAPPLRAQSGNCPCWGHLVALARFPFVPRAGRAFEEVTPRFVSSPASCPCPASSILPAGSFGIRLSAATRPELGVGGIAFTCVRAHRQTPLIHTHSLSTPQHTHTHALTYARLLRHPPATHSRAWGRPELRRLGTRAGKTQQEMPPSPFHSFPAPPPTMASLRKGPRPALNSPSNLAFESFLPGPDYRNRTLSHQCETSWGGGVPARSPDPSGPLPWECDRPDCPASPRTH